jgi:hypothetical protein
MKFLKIIVLFLFVIPALAQDIPVDINNISDQQLAQIMVKYQLQGMAPEEIDQVLKQKGVPADQIIILNRRIASLDPLTGASQNAYKTKTKDEITVPRKKIEMSGPSAAPSGLRVFGSEIFENQNLSFEPNLTISTPRN